MAYLPPLGQPPSSRLHKADLLESVCNLSEEYMSLLHDAKIHVHKLEAELSEGSSFSVDNIRSFV